MTNLYDLVLFLIEFRPEGIFEFIYTHTCYRGDEHDRQVEFLQFLGGLQFFKFFLVNSIYLGYRQDTCLGQQLRIILLQLIEQYLIFFDDIFAGSRNHKEQYCIALDMAKEPQTEAFTFTRALYDTRDIGHTERPTVTVRDNTELRRQRGKRIVCYLRLGGRNDTQECRFARIREAYETHIRQHFELHDDRSFLCRFTGLRIARRLIGSCTEMPVT